MSLDRATFEVTGQNYAELAATARPIAERFAGDRPFRMHLHAKPLVMAAADPEPVTWEADVTVEIESASGRAHRG